MTVPSSPSKPEIDFSVVISCYFEEQSIDEFYTRLSNTLNATGRGYEIIFVNDGSTDRTFKKLKAIFDSDPKVTAVIDLFKNSGQSNAKTPGILQAKGNSLVIIDSDLQLDPEELPLLIQKFDQGYDIVSGFRSSRKDSLSRKLPSIIANGIMRKASRSNLKDFGCGFKIYDMRLVRAFNFDPFNPWRPVPVIARAKRIAEVPVSHHSRKYGQSGWTFKKLFEYNMENIVNLSGKPFQILGLVCFVFSILFVFRIILAFSLPFSILPKVTGGLILNVLLLNLLITVSILTIMGEFVIRNFIRLQKMPAYVVREIFLKNMKD